MADMAVNLQILTWDDVEKIQQFESSQSTSTPAHPFHGCSCVGLRTVLRRFDEKGDLGECGPWRIVSGGYDQWWTLNYENNTVVSCYASGQHNGRTEIGYLEKEDSRFPDDLFRDVCKIVKEEYPECEIHPKELAAMKDRFGEDFDR